jgi:hypothetical protein
MSAMINSAETARVRPVTPAVVMPLCRWTSLHRAEDYVDSSLSGYFRNEICPSAGKRSIADRYALPDRSNALKFGSCFDAKPYIEHVIRRGHQLNVNLEATVLDRSLHEDLRFVQGA